MKKIFISDILGFDVNNSVDISGWIKSKQDLGGTIFVLLEDSTGFIQVVVKDNIVAEDKFQKLKALKPESAIRVVGVLKEGKNKAHEIEAKDVEVIGEALISIEPSPRSNFDLFDKKYVNINLSKRHLYLRNKKMMSVLRFKSNFLYSMHEWFNKRGFVFIDAPVITQTLLYDDSMAFPIDFFGTKMFLSQCVAFQLEAAVHGFEKVYNITPSFRAEKSRTNRHLAEYWHLKAEVAFADLDDMKKFAEEVLYETLKSAMERSSKEIEEFENAIDINDIKPPYKSITYDEAIDLVQSKGSKIEWGASLGADEEKILSEDMKKPVFVKGIPCSAESFPFKKDSSNEKETRTEDLIAPNGFGEVLGVAEKICDKQQLLDRMKEKGRETPEELERYRWYIELRDYGCVPHSGLGAGIDRIVRWALGIENIRNTISFPRAYGRVPYP
ncbi:MAG: amino acid--tRNA ligase-related protein [Candidatus Micrarchaeia archaeon]